MNFVQEQLTTYVMSNLQFAMKVKNQENLIVMKILDSADLWNH